MNTKCPQCGAPRSTTDTQCKYCGEKLIPLEVTEGQINQSPKPNLISNKPQYKVVNPIHITTNYEINKPKEKKKSGLKIIGVFFLVFFIFGIIQAF